MYRACPDRLGSPSALEIAPMKFSFPIGKLALVAVPLALAVSGCAETFDAKVSRFSAQLPAPQGQSFAVVPDDPRDQGGLEFAQYAGNVSEHLAKLGYVQATSSATADLIVHFGYSVDQGHDRVRNIGPAYDPFWTPWYGGGFGGFGHGRYGGFYGGSFGGGFGGGGFYRHGGWGYGWYDPFFYDSGIDVVRVFQSKIDIRIDRRGDASVPGQRLFEGKAQAASTSGNLTYLVPNLVEAMFTGFPGNSGQTVHISIAPEKKKAAMR
jgi:hypothetical protein